AVFGAAHWPATAGTAVAGSSEWGVVVMSKRPMHVAVFIYCLTGGGAQRRTLTLANAFAARGHQVDLVVVSSEERCRAQVRAGVRLIPLDVGWRRWLAPLTKHLNVRGFFTAGAVTVFARYLRRERPDVVLSAASHVNLVAVVAHRIAGLSIPLVLRASNQPSGNLSLWPVADRVARRFLRWMASRVYPWADHVIAVSEGVARDLVTLTGMPSERITTIYNPVVTPEVQERASAPLEHPWFAPGSPPVVLGVGKFKIQKDFPTLVRAFARVRAARPARLVILGEGGERGKIEHLARELGVADDVGLPGFMQNPFAWMSRASVFVLSSAWEGLPGALIEALACGCPVVSTDCPSGPDEILDHGAFGPLVPVGDDRALADAILSVLQKPPDRERLRARGAMFAVEPAVDRYLEVLQAQVQARPRPLAGEWALGRGLRHEPASEHGGREGNG
ncbi:MAG: glycosyltransferase, partial [Candidatus Binatia bacterium]